MQPSYKYFTMKIEYILPLLILFLLTFCSPLPDTTHYEIEGLVSIEAETAGENDEWSVKHSFNSTGLISAGVDDQTTADFEFYISKPGNYSLWVLAWKYSDDDRDNFLPVELFDGDYSSIEQINLQLPNIHLPRWENSIHEHGGEATLHFSEPGIYTLRINSAGKEGLRFDKIHLTHENSRQPEGLGYPESVNPNMDPVDIKRELPRRIPPSRSFGLMFGGEDDVEFLAINEWLQNHSLSPDAFLLKNSVPVTELREINPKVSFGLDISGQNLPRETAEEFLESGGDYLTFFEETDINKIEEFYALTQNHNSVENGRGSFISGVHHTNDTDFQRFPSNHLSPNHVPLISDEGDGSLSPMEVLENQIRRMADSRLSVYELPYLSQEMPDFRDMDESEREEAFMRWFQFAVFNPVMPAIQLSNTPLLDNPSDKLLENFKRYAELRNELFPFIYTFAHYNRQTGVKIVEGDGRRFNQFTFGESILVAPMYELGMDERSIYFPEGTWYDYYSGRAYQGGRSWFYEGTDDRIPLFVKAGSVIPYRQAAQSLKAGTNDTLRVEIYTGGAGTFRLTEDDQVSENYLRGIAARTMFRYNEVQERKIFTIGAVQNSYAGMENSRSYRLEFLNVDEKPDEVFLNDQELPESRSSEVKGWKYDEEKRLINLHLPNLNRHEKADIEIY